MASQGQTVLVVEDESSIASFVALYLKNAGYRIQSVGNGRDALERVAADLRALSSTDARAAGGTVTATMRLPREQLMAIASYALRAL